MREDAVRQLESEILRHYSLASMTDGLIRSDHLRAAELLGDILLRLRGDQPRQRSKWGKRSASRLPRFLVKSMEKCLGGRFCGK